MKKLVTILISIISIQIGFSQACGIYKINYVGKIVDKTYEIQSIKLPTIQFLHGFKKIKAERAFVETNIKDGKFELQLTSQLTSNLFDNPKTYWSLYQNIRKSIPVIFIIKNGKELKEITVEIPWSEILVTKIEDENFENLFQINLKEIKIK